MTQELSHKGNSCNTQLAPGNTLILLKRIGRDHDFSPETQNYQHLNVYVGVSQAVRVLQWAGLVGVCCFWLDN